MTSINVLGYAGKFIAMTATLSLAIFFVSGGILVAIHICTVRRVFAREIVAGEAGCGERRSRGLSPEELERLPWYRFEERRRKGGGDCAVCLEGFERGEACRMLPACGHSFHAVCVDPWLVRKHLCPICRRSVIPVGGFRSPEEQSVRVTFGGLVGS